MWQSHFHYFPPSHLRAVAVQKANQGFLGLGGYQFLMKYQQVVILPEVFCDTKDSSAEDTAWHERERLQINSHRWAMFWCGWKGFYLSGRLSSTSTHLEAQNWKRTLFCRRRWLKLEPISICCWTGNECWLYPFLTAEEMERPEILMS